MNSLLQEHISQALADQSNESANNLDLLIEAASLESELKLTLADMNRGANMAYAIERLDVDTLSNESYQVAIESILTAGGSDHLPAELLVPSFESSTALMPYTPQSAGHADRVEKKKGFLSKIWEFVKAQWRKFMALLDRWLGRKKQGVTLLLTQQKEMEVQASKANYNLKLAHEQSAPVRAVTGGATSAPAATQAALGHAGRAGIAHSGHVQLGYSTAKTVNLGVLGNDAAGVAHGAHAVATHAKQFTGAVVKAFSHLKGVDFTKNPSRDDILKTAGFYNDKFTVGTTDVTMSITRTGAQVMVHGKGMKEFSAHPEQIPTRELLLARAALIDALDFNAKSLEVCRNESRALEGIADQMIAANANDEQAHAINRVCHIASQLITAPVEAAIQPGLREIDKLLGVGHA